MPNVILPSGISAECHPAVWCFTECHVTILNSTQNSFCDIVSFILPNVILLSVDSAGCHPAGCCFTKCHGTILNITQNVIFISIWFGLIVPNVVLPSVISAECHTAVWCFTECHVTTLNITQSVILWMVFCLVPFTRCWICWVSSSCVLFYLMSWHHFKHPSELMFEMNLMLFSFILDNITLLSLTSAECHPAECCFTKCHGAILNSTQSVILWSACDQPVISVCLVSIGIMLLY
jgi:hypothetical protein